MDEREFPELASSRSNAPSAARPVVQSETPDRVYESKWLREVLISLTFSVLIIVFLYQPVKVEGTSMMPGLADQERIFINQFAYRLGPIKRGDVVVFRYPGNPGKKYIKRVVGEPGDRIEISRGEVFVNGNRLEEPYVPAQFRDQRSMSELIIPEESYFVLGDHRNLSSDSREFGPVGRKAIFGKAVFAYWPADMAGKLR